MGFRDLFRRGEKKNSGGIDPEGIFQVTLFIDEDFPADRSRLSSSEVMRIYLEPLGLDVDSLQENGCHLSAGLMKKLPATLSADFLEAYARENVTATGRFTVEQLPLAPESEYGAILTFWRRSGRDTGLPPPVVICFGERVRELIGALGTSEEKFLEIAGGGEVDGYILERPSDLESFEVMPARGEYKIRYITTLNRPYSKDELNGFVERVRPALSDAVAFDGGLGIETENSGTWAIWMARCHAASREVLGESLGRIAAAIEALDIESREIDLS